MRILGLLTALLITTLPSNAFSRLNPIRYLTDQVIRPEIVLVLDTSGSMLWNAPNSNTTGNDCSGNDPSIDVCGDFICSGYETTSGYYRGNDCSTDCRIYNDSSTSAGSTHTCNFENSSTPTNSRMQISKRAMQNVLADFRGVASFGLVTFEQTGYYRYSLANSATTRTVGLYLHQWEMRSAGSWTQGLGWDPVNDRPASSFTVNGVTYTLNGGTAGNSLYRRTAEAPVSAPLFKGWDPIPAGCSGTNRCGWGEGDCDNHSQCQSGLVCGTNNGEQFFNQGDHDWSPHSLQTLDVCVPSSGTPTSPSYQYTRVDWAGFRYTDGVNDWTYIGSYYTYTAHGHNGVAQVGVFNGWSYCRDWRKCPRGEGDCGSDNDCQSGLVCRHNHGDEYFPPGFNGMSSSDIQSIDVCELPGGSGLPSAYMGPEFIDNTGTRYVYHRFGDNRGYDTYGMSGSGTTATVKVGLFEANEGTQQEQYDQTLGEILNRMNTAPAGGLHGAGNTPTCAAIRMAQTLIEERRDGNGPYSNPDVAGGCRPRFVVVISDGESNPDCSNNGNGGQMQTYVATLFGMGVKTYAVTIPGISSSGRVEMDLLADIGDDGLRNHSTTALYSNNEKELVDNIRRVLFDAIKGQYTTTAAGVASSGSTTMVGDLAVIPSTEFPGWYGHLRTVDLTKLETDEGYELWDAGQVLEDAAWRGRPLFTGSHHVNSGTPIPLMATDSSGAVNLNGSCVGCGTAGIKSVWPGAVPSDAKIQAMVRWLAGEGRQWKLGGLIRAVPATVGPPPTKPNWPDHALYESTFAQRQKLVYIASNEGVIHAIDVMTGREMYAYVPPELLPRIFEIYDNGGQSDNPHLLKYVLSSSPRVADLKDSVRGWRTYLIQTFGAGGEDFISLDISDPSVCSDPDDSNTCVTNVRPFTAVFNSSQASPSIASKLGQTWSIPSIYWNDALLPHLSMASGYADVAGEGNWHHRFAGIGSQWVTTFPTFSSFEHLTGAVEATPFAVVANSVAIIENDGTQPVLATYQVDPLGRMYRFEGGNTQGGSVAKLVDFGASDPLLFPPAALRRNAGQRVTLSFASGAYQEQDISVDGSALEFTSGSSFESRLHVRTEEGGAVLAADEYSCTVSDICNPACYNGGNVVPSPCVGPSSRALPVSQPLVVRNKMLGGLIEVYYLLYDPPAQICQNHVVAVGDSWVVRVALNPNGNSRDLAALTKFENTQASGLVVVGGGRDIAISVTGRGSNKAGAQTLSGNRITADQGIRPIRIVGWREVR